MTTGPKIPGVVIPRSVFTQPGPFASEATGTDHRVMSAVHAKADYAASSASTHLGHPQHPLRGARPWRFMKARFCPHTDAHLGIRASQSGQSHRLAQNTCGRSGPSSTSKGELSTRL